MVLDPLSLTVGAVLFLTGYLAGRIHRRARPGRTKTPKAICGCTHGLDQHDPDTNRCHGIRRWDEKNCRCRQYVGPRPLETVFAPSLLPPAEDATS